MRAPRPSRLRHSFPAAMQAAPPHVAGGLIENLV